MEYISVSALISHLPNLGIFGEQLTKHPAIGPVFPGEGDGGALPNLESSTGGKRDMIRVRKSTDCQTETARDSRPSRALSASQGAAEGSMQHLAPVPLCPSHNERMKVNLAFTAYSCQFDGCTVTYSEEEGYVRFVNGVKQRPSNAKRCVECAAHLYLVQRGKIRSEDIWFCPNKACPSKKLHLVDPHS